MKLIDEITVSRPELRKIVAALKSPNTSKARARGRTLLLDTAEQNWVEGGQIVDLVSDLDNRVWGTCLNDITTLGEMLGLTMRTTFLKPTDVGDEPSGYMGMHLAGVACLLIWLERLGFDMSAQSLCRALAPQIANQEYVSDEELRVLQYSNAQHNMPPISIMLDPFICALGDSEVFELPN